MKKVLSFLASYLCVALLFAQADLSLSASLDNLDPGIYKTVTLTVVLTNDGPETAYNIQSRIPNSFLSAGYGLVLSQGTADIGRYNWLSVWEIDSLENGQTATLMVDMFTMKPQLPVIIGQIISCDTPDPDSEPGNIAFNNPATNGEDDEFLIDPMGATCDFDVEILNTECNGSTNNGFANVTYRVNTTNPAYERFRLTFYSGNGQSNYTDILANTDGINTFVTNQGSVRVVAEPFFGDDNCFDEETFSLPNCAPINCNVNLGFRSITCVDDANGDKFWNVAGVISSNSFGTFQIYVNGDVLPAFYNNLSVFGFGGAGSIYSFADYPTLQVQVVRLNNTSCQRTYNFNSANYCDPPMNVDCAARGLFPWHEWISNVEFDGISNESGPAQYTDYTQTNMGTVEAGETYPINLGVGYSYLTYDEYARVYVDWNQDGSFSNDEVAYEGIIDAPVQGNFVTASIAGSITVPSTARNGVARMRVLLGRGGYAGPCQNIANGEVEDYALTIFGGEPGGCEPTAMTSDVICENNGTPDDPSDDRYFFTLDVNGSGLVAGEEINLADGNDQFVLFDRTNALVGNSFQVGPISIADNPTIQIKHVGRNFPYGQSPICVFPAQMVTAPATCSDGTTPDCGQSVSFSNLTCDPGSFFSSQDDRYSFELLVDGDNIGDPVSIYADTTVQSFIQGIPYDADNAVVGTPFTVGPVFSQNYPTSKLIIALPNSGTTCVLNTFEVIPPADCLNQGIEPTENCEATSEFPWEDWISNVKIGTMENASGKSEFSDFTNLNPVAAVPGGVMDVELTTTFSWFGYTEYWRVWIDYNHDGIYEASEVAFEGMLPKPPDGSVERTVSGQITVPATAMPGNTTMRIIMTRNGYAPPCGTVLTGEVEDYAVNIAASIVTALVTGDLEASGYVGNWAPAEFTTYPNPTADHIHIWMADLLEKPVTIELVNGLGTVEKVWNYDRLDTPGVDLNLITQKNGVYAIRISSPNMRSVTKRVVKIDE